MISAELLCAETHEHKLSVNKVPLSEIVCIDTFIYEVFWSCEFCIS